jgi:CheY-like chemotaxis protein
MTGTVHVARDITERKRAEEELRRAKEAAEASTLAKSRFLANMSHELRTPMTGVIGMLDLVLSGSIEAEQKEFVEVARSSASSLIRILNDILDLTKIEAGKFAIEEKRFSIRECVKDTVSLLLPSALGKGLDMNFTVADDVPEILVADHLRLSQVLTNLVGNAVKFTEKGEVEISVTANSKGAGGKGELTFTVADSGVGIPDDKKHLLFQVFSQVDDSHSRVYGGTGLGLAISREIVERMGGKITFTSEEGKGSTFVCTIPLNTHEEKQDIVATTSVEPQRSAEVAGSEEIGIKRLLVVEDDITIRQVLGLMLKRSNFEVDFAENGEEAVEVWEKGEFDLVLMDVQMPGMNGFEATSLIREKERTRGGHTPIIAMTAHALKEDEDKCFAAGMDSYISKPIDFKKSLQMIRDLIVGRRQ